MADAHPPATIRYIPTLSLLLNVMVRIGLPTLLAMLIANPNTADPWVSVIGIGLVVFLFGAWLIRFLMRRAVARRRPRASPLHRLQEWEGSPDQVDPLEQPPAHAYALWKDSFTDRLMQAWGRPLGRFGEGAITLAALLSFLAWLLFYFTILGFSPLKPLKAQIVAATGLPLWIPLLLAALIVSAFDIRQWARRTLKEVRRHHAA